jgi:hypothetical protein
MTNIEMDVARSTIRMNKAVADHLQDIDWEQRRYEAAKDILCTMMRNYAGQTENVFDWICDAVDYADMLIDKLKQTQDKK